MKRWAGTVVLVAVAACGDADLPSASTSIAGIYRSSYTLTRTSDLPPSEGDVAERTTWEIRGTAVGSEGVFNVLADPGCPVRPEGTC